VSAHDPFEQALPADAGGEAPAPDDAAVEEALDPLTRAERERDEHLDTLRRLAAEFDNYKKRIAREHEELRERAAERLLREGGDVVLEYAADERFGELIGALRRA
jgi:molecular chaperone GrpE (heat shock protein)